MALDDQEIRITIGEGKAAREVVCRRPLHGEYDPVRVEILMGGVTRQQEAIRALEAGPTDGAAEKVGAAVALANDGLKAIQARLLKALDRIAPEADRAACRAWLTEESGAAWAGRVVELYGVLSRALAPPSLPGK